jgi:Tol biopolymer transport system component
MTWLASWSPDGRWLTYIESDHVSVMEADSQKVITIPVQGWPGWLPDGRLIVSNLFDEGPQDQRVAHVVNVETREDVTITGTYHTWSPNGKQLAYNRADDTLWIADADGRNARQIAAGGLPVWSPDGKRLAFWGGLLFEPAGTYTQTIPTEIQVMDVANSIVRTLARKDDLLGSADNSGQQGQLGSLAWSPDGLLLAVGIQREPEGSVLVLNADVGTVHTVVGRGALFPFPFIQSWSPDSRYLILWVTPVLHPRKIKVSWISWI